MIYEFRTYTLKPRSLAEVEKRYGEAYEYRKKYSPLAAFWHTEVGPLNEIIHVWGYKDLAERARIRAEAAKDPNWPPKIREFLVDQDVEVLTPFPFIPDVTPGTMGPIFEIRTYVLKPTGLPPTIATWEKSAPARQKLSPILAAMYSTTGEVTRFMHIWPYPDLVTRANTRKTAIETGVWPPPGGPDQLLAMHNDIYLPAAFSPIR